MVLFVDASFQINPGEKVGLVGPNGAGKSTVFRLIVDEDAPDDGNVEKPRNDAPGRADVDGGRIASSDNLLDIGLPEHLVARHGAGQAPANELVHELRRQAEARALARQHGYAWSGLSDGAWEDGDSSRSIRITTAA